MMKFINVIYFLSFLSFVGACGEKPEPQSHVNVEKESVEQYTVLTYQFSNQAPDPSSVQNDDLKFFTNTFQSEISEQFALQKIKNFRWFTKTLKDEVKVALIEIEFSDHQLARDFEAKVTHTKRDIPLVRSRSKNLSK